MASQLRVVLFRECEKWVAQGLEHDICAQGVDLKEVLSRFSHTVQVEHDENEGSLSHIERAPDRFFEAWEKKSGTYLPDFPEDKSVPAEYALCA